MKKLAFLFIAIAGFAVTSNAQVSATAASSATIITPIAIAKTADLNFGNLAVSPTVAGTVVLSPSATRTPSGGVTLPAVTGTVSAASFTVTGLGTSTFAITLPGTITLTDASLHTMSLGSFTSTPSSTGTLAAGSATVTVGGTLTVAAAQAAGTYTNAAGLSVTVNYN